VYGINSVDSTPAVIPCHRAILFSALGARTRMKCERMRTNRLNTMMFGAFRLQISTDQGAHEIMGGTAF
jgi:hypothetical protein